MADASANLATEVRGPAPGGIGAEVQQARGQVIPLPGRTRIYLGHGCGSGGYMITHNPSANPKQRPAYQQHDYSGGYDPSIDAAIPGLCNGW